MSRIYFKQLTKRGQIWFGDKSKRDQWVIAILAIFGFSWLLFILMIEPVFVDREEKQQRLNRLISTTAQYDRDIQQLQSRLNENPNRPLEQQLRQLTLQSERLEGELLEIAYFVEPHALVSWLQSMLEGTAQRSSANQVSVRSFVIQPPAVFLESRVDYPIYRHDVEVTLDGRYFAIRDYLNRIQDLPYGSYWQGLQYEVEQHPNSRVTLRLFTLTQQRVTE